MTRVMGTCRYTVWWIIILDIFVGCWVYAVNGGLYFQRGSKRCLPVFNCQPGHYVKECKESGMKETCVKCEPGMVQPYLISSLDTDERRKCFKPAKNYKDLCSGVNIPSRQTAQPCGYMCACNVSQCSFGDPCFCETRRDECRSGTELNVETGDCEPCPELKYKLNRGCGPCLINETAYWLKYSSQSTLAPTAHKPGTTAPPDGIATERNVPVTTEGKVLVVKTTIHSVTQETRDNGEDSMSPTAYIIVPVVCLVVILIIAGVVLVCCKCKTAQCDRVKQFLKPNKPAQDAEGGAVNGEAIPLNDRPPQDIRDDASEVPESEDECLGVRFSGDPGGARGNVEDIARPFLPESPEDGNVPPVKPSKVVPIEQEESPSPNRNRNPRPRVTIPNPPLNDDHIKTPIADTSPHDYGQRPVYTGHGAETTAHVPYPPQEAIIDSQPSSVEDSVGPSPGSNITDIRDTISFPNSPTQCTEDLVLSGATPYSDQSYLTRSRQYVPGSGPLEHEEDTNLKAKEVQDS